MGLFSDEFTVFYVGVAVPFFVNNFIFPEAEGGGEREEVNIYSLSIDIDM